MLNSKQVADQPACMCDAACDAQCGAHALFVVAPLRAALTLQHQQRRLGVPCMVAQPVLICQWYAGARLEGWRACLPHKEMGTASSACGCLGRVMELGGLIAYFCGCCVGSVYRSRCQPLSLMRAIKQAEARMQ